MIGGDEAGGVDLCLAEGHPVSLYHATARKSDRFGPAARTRSSSGCWPIPRPARLSIPPVHDHGRSRIGQAIGAFHPALGSSGIAAPEPRRHHIGPGA